MMFGTLLILSSCDKRGCTNSNASNYCVECKEDDGSCYTDRYKSRRVFWFDKTTSDSLIANGYSTLYCWVHDAPNGTPAAFKGSSTRYFSASPTCDSTHMMAITYYLKRGEALSLSFLVADSAKAKYIGYEKIKNWGGNISISAGECTVTQLIW
jgi:hypothetical protein